MLQLSIKKFQISSRLGWPDKERETPQTVLVDVSLFLSSEKSTTSEDLADTVDYTKVASLIELMAGEKSWKLIETMCFDISGEIIRSFPIVEAVEIEITKNVVPHTDGVSAKLRLERSSL